MPIVEGQFPDFVDLADITPEQCFPINGGAAAEGSGYQVIGNIDLNLDGNPDVALSSPASDIVYIIWGTNVTQINPLELSTMNIMQGVRITGPTGGYTGDSLCIAGNMTGMGKGSLGIGAGRVNPDGQAFYLFANKDWNSTVQLTSNLNKPIGYVLNGGGAAGTTNYAIGYAVASVDIDGSGRKANIFGTYFAPATQDGTVFVVFWNDTITSSPSLFSSLTGNIGFELDGSPTSAPSCCGNFGKSVVAIGANNFMSCAPGRSDQTLPGYCALIIGNQTFNFSAPAVVTSLPASQAVIFNGEGSNDHAGNAAADAGDPRSDGKGAFIICASQASPPGRPLGGKGYLGFNKNATDVPWPSQVSLSGFNSTTGYGVTIIGAGPNAKACTAAAGGFDFNNDGHQDVAICSANQLTVLWGKAKGEPWPDEIDLGNITANVGVTFNGTTGFCNSVAYAGDFDSDGVDDIIASNSQETPVGGNTGAGVTRILKGDALPQLVVNNFQISPFAANQTNQTLPFGPQQLAVTDRNHGNSSLTYLAQNVTTSYVQSRLNRGVPVANFTQAQINNFGDYELVVLNPLNGNITTFNFKIVTPGFAFLGPVPANITVVMLSNTTASTSAPTPTSAAPTAAPTFGPSVAPTSAPSITPTTASPTPTPTPAVPVLQRATFTMTNGEWLNVTPANLQADKPGFNITQNGQLFFLTSNVITTGILPAYFYRIPANVTLSSFQQMLVQSGNIQLRHPGNGVTPSFYVQVCDRSTVPAICSAPVLANVSLAGAPTLNVAPLNLTVCGSIPIDSQVIQVTVSDGSTPDEITIVPTVQDASVEVVEGSNAFQPANFTYADVLETNSTWGLQLITSCTALTTPSIQFTAYSNNGIASAPQTPATQLRQGNNLAPVMNGVTLTIAEDQTVTLTPDNVQATKGDGTPLDPTSLFTQNGNSQNGYLSIANRAGQTTTFTAGELSQRTVVQYTSNAAIPPRFSLQVLDVRTGLSSVALPVRVFYEPRDSAPDLIPGVLHDQVATVGKPMCFSVDAFTQSQGDPFDIAVSKVDTTTNQTAPLSASGWLNYDASLHEVCGTATTAGVTEVLVTATAHTPSGDIARRFAFAVNAYNEVSSSSASSSTSLGSKIGYAGAALGVAGTVFRISAEIFSRWMMNHYDLSKMTDNDRKYLDEVVLPVARMFAKPSNIRLYGPSGMRAAKWDKIVKAARAILAKLNPVLDINDLYKIMNNPQVKDDFLANILNETRRYCGLPVFSKREMDKQKKDACCKKGCADPILHSFVGLKETKVSTIIHQSKNIADALKFIYANKEDAALQMVSMNNVMAAAEDAKEDAEAAVVKPKPKAKPKPSTKDHQKMVSMSEDNDSKDEDDIPAPPGDDWEDLAPSMPPETAGSSGQRKKTRI